MQSPQTKAQLFLADSFLFTIICALCILMIAGTPGPQDNTFLLEYALAQDAAESCSITGEWTLDCFRILEKSGLSPCLEKNCGEINFQRNGKYLGINRLN